MASPVQSVAARGAFNVAAAVAAIVLLFPFAVMFVTSLKHDDEIFVFADQFRFWPASPKWGNYTHLAEQLPNLGRYFVNSAIISVGATLLALVAGVPAAYALARLQFRGKFLILNLVLIAQMFSPIVIIIGLFKLFAGTDVSWFYTMARSIGLGAIIPANPPPTLINNLVGLILANAAFNLAFCIWLLTGYLGAVPREVEEAAMVDGCSWHRMMLRVLLPMAAPGVVTAMIFVFISSWNEFVFALTFLSAPEKKTIIVGLFSLVGMFEVRWNLIMAGALLATVPVVILFWLAEKHLVGGLTAGSVKS